MRIVLTPGGRRRLQSRLSNFRQEFDAVVEDMPAALESGDTSGWHDNFAVEDNQRRMHQLTHRIRELERLLDAAEIIQVWTRCPPRAFVGAAVRWRFLDDPEGLERQLWLAGYGDGDPEQHRVSYDSPLGRAILGAEVGDLREVVLATGPKKVEILDLDATPAGADDLDLGVQSCQVG